MRFLTRAEVRPRFEGRTVAVVGSGPGCLDNPPGRVDGHEVVLRVNNYRTGDGPGRRADVFYSFFGVSIRKTAEELRADGVTLCMSKIPDADISQHGVDASWHRRQGKMIGVDFRPHFRRRADWWFCDAYLPTVEEFLAGFDLLGRHMPTSGFAAILDVLSFAPARVYLTGFDFFRSGIHNVSDPWRAKNLDDPIGHVPEAELAWLRANAARHPIACDPTLERLLA